MSQFMGDYMEEYNKLYNGMLMLLKRVLLMVVGKSLDSTDASWKGQLLSAIAKDGNGQMYPVA